MSILLHHAATAHQTDESYRGFMSLCDSLGRFPTPLEQAAYEAGSHPDDVPPLGDDGFEPDLPDFQPTEEDARWWAERVGQLEAQRPKVGPLSLPEHDAAITVAKSKTTADALKAHRDALLREVLGYTLATIDAGMTGWSGDRLAEIGAVDADLMLADETHRPFVGWACYRARLLKHGKPETFRPRRLF